MSIKQTRSLIAVVILGLLVSGCIGAKSPPPTNINAEIRAASDVNPDDSNRPSPIILRIYALKSVGGFNASDFFTLYNNEGELGGDLINREEVQLTPGGQKIFARELPADAHYLGVVAAYRQLTSSVWKDSVPIPGGRTTNFSIQLDRNSVSINLE